MHAQIRKTPAFYNLLWHFPAVVVIAIYLPAALWGAYIFRDVYAGTFLVLLVIFAALYYGLYGPFARALSSHHLRSWLWGIGNCIHWRGLAWLAVIAYVATICLAALTVSWTPLGMALKGGNVYEIASARAEFFVNREGAWAVFRYLGVILGRAVLPFLITYAYWSGHRARHVALAALLVCYLVPLEKASPLFAFLPLIVLRLLQSNWKAALGHVVSLLACLALWTFLSTGGLHDPSRVGPSHANVAATKQQAAETSRDVPAIKPHGDPRRHYLFNSVNIGFMNTPAWLARKHPIVDRLLWVVNRAIWIPYVTAYDWLKFHDDVLGGERTLGRQIGILSRLMGKPRLALEQMVYQYQYGASPGDAGASNTVFFVDAKLAFGWLGVLAYCIAFTLFAAIVFTSANAVAQISSVTSFFTAALSPLTATLLSGGLFFYIAIAVLTRLDPNAQSPGQATS